MTVLQRKDARGFDSGPIRKYVVGVALAVVGVGAAFGLSQVIDQQTTPVEIGRTPVELKAAAAGEIESMRRLDQALIQRWQPAPEFTLADELAALRAKPETTSPAAIEQARGQAMVDHFAGQWQAGAGTSQSGPR